MAKKQNDRSGDITGGRDALGTVHSASDEEVREATRVIEKLGKRWAIRNRRTRYRRDVAIEEALLACGLMEEKDASHAWHEFNRRRTLATGSDKNWFKGGE